MKLDALMKAYKAIEENKGSDLPEEFSFLLTPEFKEKMKAVKDSAEAIMLAAELLGEQIGEEKVTEDVVDELAGAMKEEGLLPENKEGEVGEEEMEADTEKPEIEGDEEKAKPIEGREKTLDEEPGEIRGQQEGQENVEEIAPEEVVGAKGEEEEMVEGEEKPAEIKPAIVDGKPTIDGDEAAIGESPIGEGSGGDAIEVPPETVKERAMAAIGALLVKK